MNTDTQATALAHYTALAAEAQALKQRRLSVEPAEFAMTGSVYVQPWAGMRDEFHVADCGALDAPSYTPTGSVEAMCMFDSDTTVYAMVNVARAGAWQ